MNNDIEQFEKRLKSLTPAPPSAALLEQLAATRPAPAMPAPHGTDWRAWFVKIAIPLAAAACAAIAVRHFLMNQRPLAGPIVIETRFRPVEGADYLVTGREIGVYHAPDGRAYRLLQCLGVNRQVWENVADKTRVEYAYPEQRLLLVSMKTL